MYSRTDSSGQWSVYAEFTISHPGASDPENIPQTRTEQNDNSVRMTYSWNSQGNNTQNTWVPTGNIPSETASNPSTYTENRAENRTAYDAIPGYGFQKGNLIFTSTPPSRRPSNLPNCSRSRLNTQESSGYGSNLLSPNSMSSTTSMQHQDGRKCRSTCNITLCASQYPAEGCHHHCGRSQSLRCQTPSLRSDCKNSFYGCGDPWCHHLKTGDDYSLGGRCSPVLEACEDCTSPNSRSNKATRSLSRELDNRKDVSVQTFDMVDKCTSPFLRADEPLVMSERTEKKRNKKVRRRSLSSYSRKAEPIYQRSNSPSSFTPDSLESGRNQRVRRLVRSPKLKGLLNAKVDKSEISTTSTTDDKSGASKKPRTVHIDVYCTGTEVESDSSNTDESDNDTASTPQTVFESEQVKITHKRADTNDIPTNIQEDESTRSTFRLHKQLSEDRSDSDDGGSTAYPSKLSSYSTIRDFASSISSVPRSWTNYSISSCAIPDPDYDSVANTSWKDNTYSDLDSALHSRSSIAGTESSLFVPRKLLDKNSSIDERPELVGEKWSKSPSGASLQMSDSFEYANSEDKLRIKRMEEVWQKEKRKQETEDSVESRHRKQEKKMNDYIQKKLKRLAKKESKETDSDDSGEGWTFVKDHIGDSGTVKRGSKDAHEDQKPENISTSEKNNKREPKRVNKDLEKKKLAMIDQGSLSDSSPSPSCRTPSSVALLQRLSLDPNLRAPFTLAPGLYTEQRSIAKKFGPVISAFKKPGHHIGPVRNPECACAHCKAYYESVGFRSRTRSLGDPPSQNWHDLSRTQ